ncbi:MAG: FAD-dependent oxidoreductase [Deltaproteobacteria bacterium]|nr:FAD-dependent oxidoreductase [Deltaproteobacteria bacterium]
MNQSFPALFSSGKINSLEIKNRFVMGPMGTLSMDRESCCPTSRMIEHYSDRARGGVGLIIVEPALVGGVVPPGVACLRLDSDEFIAEFRKLSDAIKKNGSKAAIQLVSPLQLGLRLKSGPEQTKQIDRVGNSFMAVVPPRFGYDAFAEITTEEFDICKEGFVNSAIRAKEAGFDAVEFHACHGSFLCASLSPFSNRRSDEYGGSAANRARLICEIVALSRQETGQDFPLIVRVSASEFLEGGTTLESTIVQAKLMEEAGVDALHITGGSQHRLDWHAPPYYMDSGPLLFHAREVKRAVNVPIIAVGKIDDLSIAERVLGENNADFISIARPLLADPEFVNKARQGRVKDIRPCIYCNKCHESTFRNPESPKLSCTVNPELLQEEDFSLKPAETPKKIMVVGGGLSGIEVARVLAERGHTVSLFEKSNSLGGQWNIASQEVLKKNDFPKLTAYMVRGVERAGVEVRLNVDVDPDMVKKEKPEAVVIATGAIPASPDVPGVDGDNVPGVDGDNVVQANDVITGKACCGERVVIVGGGYVGIEVADFLSSQGKKVSVVDLRPIGMDLGITIYHGMMDRLVNKGVCLYPNSPLYEIQEKGASIEYNHELLFLPADTVVLAVGVTPQKGLFEKLKDLVSELYSIGDCVEPRDAMNAIKDAAELGRRI